MVTSAQAEDVHSDEDAEDVGALTEEERACLEAEVEGVLGSFAGMLPEADLALMRATLLSSATDARRAELVRAATPRSIDESGEVRRKPEVAAKRLASSGR